MSFCECHRHMIWLILLMISYNCKPASSTTSAEPTLTIEETQLTFNNVTKFSILNNGKAGQPKSRQKRSSQIALVRISVKNVAKSLSPINISCYDPYGGEVCQADDVLKYGEQMAFTLFDIFTVKYSCDINFNNGTKKYTFECYDGKRQFRGGNFEVEDTGVMQLKARKPAEKILSFTH